MNSQMLKLNNFGEVYVKKRKMHIGIRHEDSALQYKLHYIAKYEGRSANAHILYLIRRDIDKFEAEHGAIPEPAEDDNS